MASVTMVGPYTYGTNNPKYNVWHSKAVSARGAVLSAVGTFTANRDSTNPSNINISASITIRGENSDVSFGFPLWFYVYANGERIHKWDSYWYNGSNWTYNLNISERNGVLSWSKTFDSFSYQTNNAVNLSFVVHCAAGTGSGTSESGSCDQGYTYVTLIDASDRSETLVHINAYNPWTDPTNLSNVRVSPAQIKPEGSVTVSWTAGSGGSGNTVDKYEVQVRDSADGANTWYSCGETTGTSMDVTPLNKRAKIKPGETLYFRARGHCHSTTTGYDDYWMSWIDAGSSVSVYKDGIIYYQQDGSTRKDCTMAYVQQDTNVRKAVRYVLVQSTETGSYKIIDEYTTHYE